MHENSLSSRKTFEVSEVLRWTIWFKHCGGYICILLLNGKAISRNNVKVSPSVVLFVQSTGLASPPTTARRVPSCPIVCSGDPNNGRADFPNTVISPPSHTWAGEQHFHRHVLKSQRQRINTCIKDANQAITLKSINWSDENVVNDILMVLTLAFLIPCAHGAFMHQRSEAITTSS